VVKIPQALRQVKSRKHPQPGLRVGCVGRAQAPIPVAGDGNVEALMNDLNVRIEELGPMRVASVHVVGEHPETEAWEKLRAWAEPRGLLTDPRQHPVFGFNNPNPSPGRTEYGYEFWICVGPEVASEGPVKVKDVPGGRFAVLTHRGYPGPQVWKQLWDWVQRSRYRWRKTHELERMHNPLAADAEAIFDLYLPIEG
jgi:DNA gyrase inhibitor GyrI